VFGQVEPVKGLKPDSRLRDAPVIAYSSGLPASIFDIGDEDATRNGGMVSKQGGIAEHPSSLSGEGIFLLI
jgi:hypothetical protein